MLPASPPGTFAVVSWDVFELIAAFLTPWECFAVLRQVCPSLHHWLSPRVGDGTTSVGTDTLDGASPAEGDFWTRAFQRLARDQHSLLARECAAGTTMLTVARAEPAAAWVRRLFSHAVRPEPSPRGAASDTMPVLAAEATAFLLLFGGASLPPLLLPPPSRVAARKGVAEPDPPPMDRSRLEVGPDVDDFLFVCPPDAFERLVRGVAVRTSFFDFTSAATRNDAVEVKFLAESLLCNVEHALQCALFGPSSVCAPVRVAALEEAIHQGYRHKAPLPVAARVRIGDDGGCTHPAFLFEEASAQPPMPLEALAVAASALYHPVWVRQRDVDACAALQDPLADALAALCQSGETFFAKKARRAWFGRRIAALKTDVEGTYLRATITDVADIGAGPVPLLSLYRADHMQLYHCLLRSTYYLEVSQNAWPTEKMVGIYSRIVSPLGPSAVECRCSLRVRGGGHPRVYIRAVFVPSPLSATGAESAMIPAFEADPGMDTVLLVGGYGRVEVDVRPVVTGASYRRVAAALRLPHDFPYALLHNVLIAATGCSAWLLAESVSLLACYPDHGFAQAFDDAVPEDTAAP